MLVPEIALTGTMLANFYRRFGKKIAILHSELTPAENTMNTVASALVKLILLLVPGGYFCPITKYCLLY